MKNFLKFCRTEKNNMKKTRKRLYYTLWLLLLLAVEVIIALFVRDAFVRPYMGDIIVMAVLYCFVKIFLPDITKHLPLYLFVFAVFVEIGQYFNYASLLGLGNIPFFKILFGSSFSFIDILCYAVGSAACCFD